jgi:hypothetical protein
MSPIQLILFAASWAIGIYAFNSVVARRFKKIDVKFALLYVSTLAMLGVYGEVILGNLYAHIFGHPLWRYTVLPVHHAYTSHFALCLWGIYGFHLYLMHDNLEKRNTKAIKYLPLLFCIEAIIIEGLVNLTFRATFGRYIFYYFPSDLWHLTSIQTLPIYLVGGYAIQEAIKRGRSDPMFFTIAAIGFAGTLVFLG